jgi:hypothetical protein
VPDTQNLIPFSHWITPESMPTHFTTQIYLYSLPMSAIPPCEVDPEIYASSDSTQPARASTATSPDGGLEITAAKFFTARTWLRLARSDDIVVNPPQFLLLHLISHFLDRDAAADPNLRIQQLKHFISSGTEYSSATRAQRQGHHQSQLGQISESHHMQ